MGLVKTYPFKIQAVIWCFLHGFVYSGFEDFQNKRFYILDEHIEIRRVKNV